MSPARPGATFAALLRGMAVHLDRVAAETDHRAWELTPRPGRWREAWRALFPPKPNPQAHLFASASGVRACADLLRARADQEDRAEHEPTPAGRRARIGDDDTEPGGSR